MSVGSGLAIFGIWGSVAFSAFVGLGGWTVFIALFAGLTTGEVVKYGGSCNCNCDCNSSKC